MTTLLTFDTRNTQCDELMYNGPIKYTTNNTGGVITYPHNCNAGDVLLLDVGIIVEVPRDQIEHDKANSVLLKSDNVGLSLVATGNEYATTYIGKTHIGTCKMSREKEGVRLFVGSNTCLLTEESQVVLYLTSVLNTRLDKTATRVNAVIDEQNLEIDSLGIGDKQITLTGTVKEIDMGKLDNYCVPLSNPLMNVVDVRLVDFLTFREDMKRDTYLICWRTNQGMRYDSLRLPDNFTLYNLGNQLSRIIGNSNNRFFVSNKDGVLAIEGKTFGDLESIKKGAENDRYVVTAHNTATEGDNIVVTNNNSVVQYQVVSVKGDVMVVKSPRKLKDSNAGRSSVASPFRVVFYFDLCPRLADVLGFNKVSTVYSNFHRADRVVEKDKYIFLDIEEVQPGLETSFFPVFAKVDFVQPIVSRSKCKIPCLDHLTINTLSAKGLKKDIGDFVFTIEVTQDFSKGFDASDLS